MERCKTCKWWGASSGSREEYRGHNTKHCGSPRIVFGGTRELDLDHDYSKESIAKDHITIDHETDEPIPADGAAVLDGSGYWGELRTGPDFGCIHHEPPT